MSSFKIVKSVLSQYKSCDTVGCNGKIKAETAFTKCFLCTRKPCLTAACTNFVKKDSVYKVCFDCNQARRKLFTGSCTQCSKPNSVQPPFKLCWGCHHPATIETTVVPPSSLEVEV